MSKKREKNRKDTRTVPAYGSVKNWRMIARPLRKLNPDSVVSAYQPMIYNTKTHIIIQTFPVIRVTQSRYHSEMWKFKVPYIKMHADLQESVEFRLALLRITRRAHIDQQAPIVGRQSSLEALQERFQSDKRLHGDGTPPKGSHIHGKEGSLVVKGSREEEERLTRLTTVNQPSTPQFLRGMNKTIAGGASPQT